MQGIELGVLQYPSQIKMQTTMFYCFYVKFKVIDLLISLPSDSTSSFPEEDKRRGSEGARERERERERERGARRRRIRRKNSSAKIGCEGARARDGAHMFCTYCSIPAPLTTFLGLNYTFGVNLAILQLKHVFAPITLFCTYYHIATLATAPVATQRKCTCEGNRTKLWCTQGLGQSCACLIAMSRCLV